MENPDTSADDDCNFQTGIGDVDGDGYSTDEDCNDLERLINPGMEEQPYNGFDDDCDDLTFDDDLDQDGYPYESDCDDSDPSVYAGLSGYKDLDLDGYTNSDNILYDFCGSETLPTGYVATQSDIEDCDDDNNLSNPGAIEICDLIDNDCDINTVDGSGESWFNEISICGQGECAASGVWTCTNGEKYSNCVAGSESEATCEDLDGDGFYYSTDNLLIKDCDDTNSSINPGMDEILHNGIDDDCNTSTFDDDLDQDGYLFADDCNDNNNLSNPGMIEVLYNGCNLFESKDVQIYETS